MMIINPEKVTIDDVPICQLESIPSSFTIKVNDYTLVVHHMQFSPPTMFLGTVCIVRVSYEGNEYGIVFRFLDQCAPNEVSTFMYSYWSSNKHPCMLRSAFVILKDIVSFFKERI